MAKPRVIFTDSPWALNRAGTPDLACATLEREVFADRVDLRLGLHDGNNFVREGPAFYDYVRGAEAIVVFRAEVTPPFLDAVGATCKVIGRQGVGYDNLHPAVLAPRGIVGFNIPDYCVDEVSSHALALALALERRICQQNTLIKAGGWGTFATPVARMTQRLTFGILGFGRIGRAAARKAEPFYGTIVAYDPYVHEDLMAGLGVRKVHDLREFMAACDVISVNALLNDETKIILGRDALRALKAGCIVVNTARGNLIEPEAMLEAIASGRAGGYGCDVFTPENPNEHPVNRRLLTFDQVIVSSHVAAYSEVSAKSQRVRCAQEVLHVLQTGEPPQFGRLA